MKDVCLIDGCNQPRKAKGLCSTHYMQYLRYCKTQNSIGIQEWIEIDKTPEVKLCLFEGCGKPAKAKGLCANHYYQHQKADRKQPISIEDWVKVKQAPIEKGVCLVEGCTEFIVAKGLCAKHYKRFQRHKDTKETRAIDWGARERHPLYKQWCGLNRNHNLNMCAEWSDFWVFAKDVGTKPEGECWFCAIDNKKPYGPDNFYWKLIDRSERTENKRQKLNEYQKAYRVVNIEKIRDKELLKKYGITLDDWNRMYKEQNGVCKICGKPETKIDRRLGIVRRLAVDHCHDTGKVRGLLCTECNQAIGLLHHDPKIIKSALEYCK